jgi:hypothetical protein
MSTGRRKPITSIEPIVEDLLNSLNITLVIAHQESIHWIFINTDATDLVEKMSYLDPPHQSSLQGYSSLNKSLLSKIPRNSQGNSKWLLLLLLPLLPLLPVLPMYVLIAA